MLAILSKECRSKIRRKERTVHERWPRKKKDGIAQICLQAAEKVA